MTTQAYKRKLTAILSTDVKDYSRRMGEDDQATVRTITAYREVFTQVVQKSENGQRARERNQMSEDSLGSLASKCNIKTW